MGKPKDPAARSHHGVVRARVTPDEREALEVRAEALGITTSELVRRIGTGELVELEDGEDAVVVSDPGTAADEEDES